MPLRVAILGVDREDQALVDVERCGLRPVLGSDEPAIATASPPLALASWRVSAAVVSSSVTDSRVLRESADAALTVSGSRSEASTCRAHVRRAVRALARATLAVHRSPESEPPRSRFVRAIAAQGRTRRQLAAEQLDDGEERRVARRVTVRSR